MVAPRPPSSSLRGRNDPADADSAGPVSQAGSIWPDTAHLRGAGSNSLFEVSRFDPQFEAKAQARTQLSAQFALCRPALALRVLVAVPGVVALGGLPLAQGPLDALTRSAVLAFGALAGALLWMAAVCAVRPWLERLGSALRIAQLCAWGGLCGGVAWAMLAWLGLAPARASAALGTAAVGVALAGSVWQWLALRALAARPVEAHARLAELQSRIRPHFLFNALNTALALVQINPQQAESVLEDLSQLFRVALAETGTAVTLDEEIDLAQRYLAIEKLRFGDRLQVVWDLDAAAANALLPPLVLQPLVENAVRHGIEPALAGGRIVVRSRVVRGMAEVQVSNTLPEVPSRSGSGIALANVAERLRLLHDVAATFKAGVEGHRFEARIQVPL